MIGVPRHPSCRVEAYSLAGLAGHGQRHAPPVRSISSALFPARSTQSSSRNPPAALSALACVPALAILPAAANAAASDASGAAGPDAALFALLAAARDLGARWAAACDAADEAGLQTVDVPPPQAMIATERDLRFWPGEVGKPISENYIDRMKGLLDLMRSYGYAPETGDPEFRTGFEERGGELTAALEQWRASREQATVRSGEVDAWKRADELLAEEEKLKARIAATPARTVAGMMAKLALVAPCCEGIELEDKGSSEDLLFSVAHDFNALRDFSRAARETHGVSARLRWGNRTAAGATRRPPCC